MAKIQCIEASVSRFENIPEPTDTMGVLKFLEGVGRTCYKSEDKITDDSCIKFIQNIHDRKHWAMLEHYIFCFQIDEEDFDFLMGLTVSSEKDSDIAEKMKYIHISQYCKDDESILPLYHMSGSATAINYLMETMQNASDDIVTHDNTNPILRICQMMHDMHPMLFSDPYPNGYNGDELEYPGYCADRDPIKLLCREDVRNLPVELRRVHDFMSYRKITDRGVTHEDVRHRPASYGQESTRYCNYSKKGYQLIIPCWFCEEDKNTLVDPDNVQEILDSSNSGRVTIEYNAYIWLLSCKQSIDRYDDLVNNGWVPQQARSILPHSIKTEICITARLNEWEHYFNMRVPTSAHPQMRELSIPMLQMASDYDPEIFLPIEDKFADMLGDKRRIQ